jgi:hypothetical protein
MLRLRTKSSSGITHINSSLTTARFNLERYFTTVGTYLSDCIHDDERNETLLRPPFKFYPHRKNFTGQNCHIQF